MRIKKPARKTLIRVLIVLGAAALFVFLITAGGLLLPEEEKVLAPPLRQPDAVEYDTHTVTKGSITNTVTCRGYLFPEKQVDIAFSNREGFLKSIYVSFGQYVSAGQPLAALDTDTLENEIKRQRLILEEAEQTHAKLKAISVPETAASLLKLEELKKELEIKNQLREGLPANELEKMEYSVKLQEYAHQKLVLEYENRIQTAYHNIEMAKLKLRELELELGKSILHAPVSGRVVYLAPVNHGEHIPPYKTMVSVADPRRLIVRYAGNQYDKFRLGMKVTLTKDGQTIPGEVILTPQQVPEEDFEKMKETVYVRPKGRFAEVNIDEEAVIEAVLERADNVIVLPRRLVHSYGGRSFVKIMEDGIVNERDVKTGITAPTEIEITSGLEPGELVVE
jgi:macrolide-specific efflux system membrane fusion protein